MEDIRAGNICIIFKIPRRLMYFGLADKHLSQSLQSDVKQILTSTCKIHNRYFLWVASQNLG